MLNFFKVDIASSSSS